MLDRYPTAWNEFLWIEAIFTFAYTCIFTILKINWGMYSIWGIVVYYNVGSLASSCKACLYPTMSLLNVCKKEKEIYKTNICIGADDYCSTNYEGFSDSLINAWHIFRIIMYICIFNIGFLKKKYNKSTWKFTFGIFRGVHHTDTSHTSIVVGDPVIRGRLWSHICVCPEPGIGLLIPYVVVYFLFKGLR